MTDQSPAYHYAVIGRALRVIDEAPPGLTLDGLAARMNMSPAHFQRTFSQWVGVSPKRYQQYLTLGHARRLLSERHTTLETAHELGLNELKFFPAHLSGGTAMLQAVRSILPKVRFCPTGGIGLHNLGDFLKQPNVFVVGGSWLTPADLLKAGDYAGITALCRQSLDIAATVLADKAGGFSLKKTA